MKLKLLAEAVFLLMTCVAACLIMLPIWSYYGDKYPFYFYNISFIIIFITGVRYLFLLRYAPFSHSKRGKVFLLFLCVPLLLYFIDGFYEFTQYLDEEGFVSISNGDLDYSQKMASYTKAEYLFFAVSAIITMIAIPFRMVISVWRQHNKGTI
jgi:hypothetical protein